MKIKPPPLTGQRQLYSELRFVTLEELPLAKAEVGNLKTQLLVEDFTNMHVMEEQKKKQLKEEEIHVVVLHIDTVVEKTAYQHSDI